MRRFACDYLIPLGENGFTREPVVALVSLAQPILKTDILEVCGTLRDTTLGALTAVLRGNLGL